MAIEKLLIIAGAGASRHLTGSRETLPLMRDWCRDLVARLNKEGRYADILGLSRDMDGPSFEEALGQFLAWQRGLPLTKSLVALGGPPSAWQEPNAQVDEWFQRASNNADHVQKIIHTSLYELFSQQRVSSVSAGRAYGWLLEQCRITPSTPLAFATTNYDVAIEMALDDLHRRPYWGQDADLYGSAHQAVHAEGLIDHALAGRVPVLHLHGRVGWYLDENGQVISTAPSAPYNQQHGQPALLLPEVGKDYTVLPFVLRLWDQFDLAIDTFSHVLVVGHSLHDDALLQRLQRVVPRGGRLAVTVFQEGPQHHAEDATQISDQLPGATAVPMNFGAEHPFVGKELPEWLPN